MIFLPIMVTIRTFFSLCNFQSSAKSYGRDSANQQTCPVARVHCCYFGHEVRELMQASLNRRRLLLEHQGKPL